MRRNSFSPTITPKVATWINYCKQNQKKFELISKEEYEENLQKYEDKKGNKELLTMVVDDNGKLILYFW